MKMAPPIHWNYTKPVVDAGTKDGMKNTPCAGCSVSIRVIDLRISEDVGMPFTCACGTRMEVDEIREFLRQLDANRLAASLDLRKGAICPCCGLFAKRYSRKLNTGAARWLIRLFQIQSRTGVAWVHTSEIIKGFAGALSGTDATTILPYWGFIEAQPDTPTSKRSSGYWRITDAGRDFVLGKTKVEDHAVVYNGVCERFEGDKTDIAGALGENFNYAELMAA